MTSNEILMMTSFPPRKCGIATYSQNLIKAIEDKYGDSLNLKVCALQKMDIELNYPSEVTYFLKTAEKEDYKRLAFSLNEDDAIQVIYLQHEFGLYGGHLDDFILNFLNYLTSASDVNKKVEKSIRPES